MEGEKSIFLLLNIVLLEVVTVVGGRVARKLHVLYVHGRFLGGVWVNLHICT